MLCVQSGNCSCLLRKRRGWMAPVATEGEPRESPLSGSACWRPHNRLRLKSLIPRNHPNVSVASGHTVADGLLVPLLKATHLGHPAGRTDQAGSVHGVNLPVCQSAVVGLGHPSHDLTWASL